MLVLTSRPRFRISGHWAMQKVRLLVSRMRKRRWPQKVVQSKRDLEIVTVGLGTLEMHGNGIEKHVKLLRLSCICLRQTLGSITLCSLSNHSPAEKDISLSVSPSSLLFTTPIPSPVPATAAAQNNHKRVRCRRQNNCPQWLTLVPAERARARIIRTSATSLAATT